MMNEYPNIDELAEATEATEATEKQPFVIDNDVKAEWAIRKLAEAKDELFRWQDFYDAQMDKVKAAYDRKRAYLEGLLVGYLRSGLVPLKETKTQSKYALPSGDLILKKPTIKYERDNDQLVDWLRETDHPDLIKTKYEADWKSLKPLTTVVGGKVVLAETGEVISGITATETQQSFDVSFKLEEEGK